MNINTNIQSSYFSSNNVTLYRKASQIWGQAPSSGKKNYSEETQPPLTEDKAIENYLSTKTPNHEQCCTEPNFVNKFNNYVATESRVAPVFMKYPTMNRGWDSAFQLS